MSDTVDPAHARRVIAQHAKTSALMGVDFVHVKPAKKAARPAAIRSTRASKSSDAESAMSELRARYEREAPHAPFISEYKNLVWDDGDIHAQLMFVGEAPGADEDEQGKPFVGRAGQLLNKMITAMGLSRESVYIANVLKVRPPGNATPTTDEIDASRPFLFEQIKIVRPKVIVALGLPASRCLLHTSDSMASLRARFHDLELESGLVIPVMPTYHPAYLLRSYTPENRKKVWEDLQMAMSKLTPA
ncbi:MAG: uracil-DNA glycosylase [Phycisphaerales bacterium]|nr:uracil-DNA glycosylase [Phycisphaerales bacterium]